MNAIDQNPTSFNFLSPINFQFILKRAPNINYVVQKINLPGIQLPTATEATPFIDFPKPGEKLSFQPLMVEFKVDEDFNNYLEIYNWLKALGRIPTSDPLKEMMAAPYYTGTADKSEIVVIILDSQKNPNINIFFHDAFPVMLSPLDFDVKQTTVTYITATVQLAYSWYDISKNI